MKHSELDALILENNHRERRSVLDLVHPLKDERVFNIAVHLATRQLHHDKVDRPEPGGVVPSYADPEGNDSWHLPTPDDGEYHEPHVPFWLMCWREAVEILALVEQGRDNQ